MIKVLHVHTLPIISGSGINTFLTMRDTDKSAYHVELACAPGGRLIELVRENGMNVRLFGNLIQPFRPHKDILALVDLTFFLKKNPYHIVHTHNSKAGFIGRLAAKLAGIPVIIHTVHGFAFHDQEPLWRRILFKDLERLASHWCDKMIFISQPLVQWALQERIAGMDKMIKIYSGIETDRFRPASQEEENKARKEWNLGKQDRVIGIVSKLWQGKGHDTLIKAFFRLHKQIKGAKLIIVGEGALEEKLRILVGEYGLQDDVIFTGFQMDVSRAISTFDVAVLPSLFEGMGRVLLEAMAMEKPVVATRVGGIPDLVEHGINGLLVPPDDDHELAEAIKKILNDKNLAEKMGKSGRKKIKNQFSSDFMTKSIEKVYKDILTKKGIGFES